MNLLNLALLAGLASTAATNDFKRCGGSKKPPAVQDKINTQDIPGGDARFPAFLACGSSTCPEGCLHPRKIVANIKTLSVKQSNLLFSDDTWYFKSEADLARASANPDAYDVSGTWEFCVSYGRPSHGKLSPHHQCGQIVDWYHALLHLQSTAASSTASGSSSKTVGATLGATGEGGLGAHGEVGANGVGLSADLKGGLNTSIQVSKTTQTSNNMTVTWSWNVADVWGRNISECECGEDPKQAVPKFELGLKRAHDMLFTRRGEIGLSGAKPAHALTLGLASGSSDPAFAVAALGSTSTPAVILSGTQTMADLLAAWQQSGFAGKPFMISWDGASATLRPAGSEPNFSGIGQSPELVPLDTSIGSYLGSADPFWGMEGTNVPWAVAVKTPTAASPSTPAVYHARIYY
jgi:hypothetical protein